MLFLVINYTDGCVFHLRGSTNTQIVKQKGREGGGPPGAPSCFRLLRTCISKTAVGFAYVPDLVGDPREQHGHTHRQREVEPDEEHHGEAVHTRQAPTPRQGNGHTKI